MNPRPLLCAALLLALPVMAQTGAARGGPGSTQAGASVGTTAVVQPPSKPEPALPHMRVECTAAAHAADLMGQHGCVAGRVSRVTYTRTGAIHISLCPARTKCSFQAVALARDQHSFGDLAYLRGRIVAVVGDITDNRGHPQIRIKDREQLQVAASEPPTDFDASQANASAKGSPVKHSLRAW